jgi:hypothetical protein
MSNFLKPVPKKRVITMCAGFVRLKFKRGDKGKSPRRNELRKTGLQLTGKDIFATLEKQGWKSCREDNVEFYISNTNMNKLRPKNKTAIVKIDGKFHEIPLWMAIENGFVLPSVDRVNSNKSYTRKNIQLTSALYNKMKGTLTDEQLMEYITTLREV